MPRKGEMRIGLPVEAWPEIDRRLLDMALAEGDLLDGRGAAAHWAAETRRTVTYAYGRWLRFLQRSGSLDPALSPVNRATPEMVASYIAELKSSYADHTVRGAICSLHDMLAAVQPDRELDWLRGIGNRLQARSQRAQPLQPRLVPARELWQAGLAEMNQAETRSSGCRRYRAAAYRDGLAVAMLIACPLRRRSFTGLRLDQHLADVGDRFLLHLGPADLKNATTLDFPLPEPLTPRLRRYLGEHRPVLLAGADSQHLWINTYGGPITEIGLAERVGELTSRQLGRLVPMHHFRHSAATGIALDDPHHVQLIAALLGHSNLRTGERYYNMASTHDAGRRHQQAMRRLREMAGRDVGGHRPCP